MPCHFSALLFSFISFYSIYFIEFSSVVYIYILFQSISITIVCIDNSNNCEPSSSPKHIKRKWSVPPGHTSGWTSQKKREGWVWNELLGQVVRCALGEIMQLVIAETCRATGSATYHRKLPAQVSVLSCTVIMWNYDELCVFFKWILSWQICRPSRSSWPKRLQPWTQCTKRRPAWTHDNTLECETVWLQSNSKQLENRHSLGHFLRQCWLNLASQKRMRYSAFLGWAFGGWQHMGKLFAILAFQMHTDRIRNIMEQTIRS